MATLAALVVAALAGAAVAALTGAAVADLSGAEVDTLAGADVAALAGASAAAELVVLDTNVVDALLDPLVVFDEVCVVVVVPVAPGAAWDAGSIQIGPKTIISDNSAAAPACRSRRCRYMPEPSRGRAFMSSLR
ncbi:MAG: hypothetical protein ACR2IK_01610 [Chloroflexota bacterium]